MSGSDLDVIRRPQAVMQNALWLDKMCRKQECNATITISKNIIRKDSCDDKGNTTS